MKMILSIPRITSSEINERRATMESISTELKIRLIFGIPVS